MKSNFSEIKAIGRKIRDITKAFFVVSLVAACFGGMGAFFGLVFGGPPGAIIGAIVGASIGGVCMACEGISMAFQSINNVIHKAKEHSDKEETREETKETKKEEKRSLLSPQDPQKQTQQHGKIGGYSL